MANRANSFTSGLYFSASLEFPVSMITSSLSMNDM